MSVARVRMSGKLTVDVAVTLEGTIIHKTGMITGGRSTHGTGRKWEEKDVQGIGFNDLERSASADVLQASNVFEITCLASSGN